MIGEIWKKIDEAPDYEVSNFGEVRSQKYGDKRIIKQNIKKSGYKEVGLCYEPNKRKWFLVHRLVLSTFNPIENMNNMEVNHKDENKCNNHLDNLEWMTSKDNCNYGNRNRKVREQQEVKVLCEETGVIYKSFVEASEKTHIDKSSINMCCTGYRNRKTAGGFHWRYANE